MYSNIMPNLYLFNYLQLITAELASQEMNEKVYCMVNMSLLGKQNTSDFTLKTVRKGGNTSMYSKMPV